MALVFDIETIGNDFDKLDDATQESLTRWIKREAGEDKERYNVLSQDLKESLGFSPLTGEIAAIGVYDTQASRGVVYFQSPNLEDCEYSLDNFIFKPKTEKEMLESFWQGIVKYKIFVSFNGRSFDLPFLMIRSAIHGIKPSLNLMDNRYLNYQNRKAKHIDLLDQLSYYGAVRRKGNLHLFCRAFGIKSPKVSGITGDDVSELFQSKEYRKIAEYNSWDLIATAELYDYWEKYLNFS